MRRKFWIWGGPNGGDKGLMEGGVPTSPPQLLLTLNGAGHIPLCGILDLTLKKKKKKNWTPTKIYLHQSWAPSHPVSFCLFAYPPLAKKNKHAHDGVAYCIWRLHFSAFAAFFRWVCVSFDEDSVPFAQDWKPWTNLNNWQYKCESYHRCNFSCNGLIL